METRIFTGVTPARKAPTTGSGEATTAAAAAAAAAGGEETTTRFFFCLLRDGGWVPAAQRTHGEGCGGSHPRSFVVVVGKTCPRVRVEREREFVRGAGLGRCLSLSFFPRTLSGGERWWEGRSLEGSRAVLPGLVGQGGRGGKVD
jgi:hypothetical protein